jgi:hypothetical protein
MSQVTLRERLWLWGMLVNVLQQGSRRPGWDDSTLTTEQAIQKTGIRNVLIAGGLPLTRETLDSLPSAKRIIAKWSIHRGRADHTGAYEVDYDRALSALMQAKQLATADARVEAYLLDDFSTGAIAAGVNPVHLQKLQFQNALHAPQLPLMATVYEMSLEDERVHVCLPYFAGFLSPLWHAADIANLPKYVRRINEISGGKPQLLCIYLYDCGNGAFLSYDEMRLQLDMLTRLLAAQEVYGAVILGTCMMDLDWDANRAFYDWLDEKGDAPL